MRLPTSCPRALVVLSLIVLPEIACHKKQVPVALPAQPKAKSEQQAGATQTAPHETTSLPPPPVLAPNAAPAATPTVPVRDETVYQRNKPPDQPPPPKRVARPANPAPSPVQGPTQTNAAPAEVPHLGDVLTPDQQKQYNAAIDQSLTHAQANLGSLANRQLSQEQQATLAQVQSFMQQALEKRKTDLAAAKSLAERADVLASDLVASVR